MRQSRSIAQDSAAAAAASASASASTSAVGRQDYATASAAASAGVQTGRSVSEADRATLASLGPGAIKLAMRSLAAADVEQRMVAYVGRRAEANRSAKTVAAYTPKQQRFLAFARLNYAGYAFPELVTQPKALVYLMAHVMAEETEEDDELIIHEGPPDDDDSPEANKLRKAIETKRKAAATKKRNRIAKKATDASSVTMLTVDGEQIPMRCAPSTLEVHVSAICKLWESQKALGWPVGQHPRGETINALFDAAIKERRKAKVANCVTKDHAKGKGYQPADLPNLARYYLNLNSALGCKLLVACTAAHQCFMRGENVRSLELSDLSHGTCSGGQTSQEYVAMRMEETKNHTKTGKAQHVGAARHRQPLCDAGFAIALLLLHRWDVLKEATPDLSSNAAWYRIKLLPMDNDNTKPISYSTHSNEIRKSFEANDMHILNTTHASRGSGARQAEEAGTALEFIKRLGHWGNTDGTVVEAYLTNLPFPAMRAMAGFKPSGDDYFLPRDQIEPPKELLQQLWPWVEEWEAKMDSMERSELSGTISDFIDLLHYLRRVLIQDIGALKEVCPDHVVLQLPLFHSQAYLDFAQRQQVEIPAVESPLNLSLSAHAPTIVEGYKVLADRVTTALGGAVQALGALERRMVAVEVSQTTSGEAHASAMRAVSAAHQNTVRDVVQAVVGRSIHSADAETQQLHRAATQLVLASNQDERATARAALARLLLVTPSSSVSPSRSPSAGPSSSPASHRRTRDESEEAEPVARPRKRPAPTITAPQYEMSKVTTVQQAWDEYWVGLNGHPSLRALEQAHGTLWSGGHGSPNRKVYTRRMHIINKIVSLPEEERAAKILAIQAAIGSRSLDAVSKDKKLLATF